MANETPNLGLSLRLSGHVPLKNAVKDAFNKLDALLGDLDPESPIAEAVEELGTRIDELSSTDIAHDGGEGIETVGATLDDLESRLAAAELALEG